MLVTRTLANTIAEGLGFSRTNQVAVTATPVTTNNQVYDAYIAFLTIPGSLQITCSPPPPGAAHVCRRFRDEYYWVPLEFRDRYVELASITTAQRGKSLLPSDDFYSVNIVGLGTSSTSSPNPTQVLVKVDQPVPISTDGLAVFENGRCVRITRFDLEENNRFDFVSDQFYLNFDSAADKASLQFPSLSACTWSSRRLGRRRKNSSTESLSGLRKSRSEWQVRPPPIPDRRPRRLLCVRRMGKAGSSCSHQNKCGG